MTPEERERVFDMLPPVPDAERAAEAWRAAERARRRAERRMVELEWEVAELRAELTRLKGGGG